MERLSGFDFRIELHKGFMPRSRSRVTGRIEAFAPAYVVSIENVAGVNGSHRTIEYYPFTEEGYTQADAMAQRLVLALEVSTQPTRTGLPRSGLAVDYVREMRSHEEAVE